MAYFQKNYFRRKSRYAKAALSASSGLSFNKLRGTSPPERRAEERSAPRDADAKALCKSAACNKNPRLALLIRLNQIFPAGFVFAKKNQMKIFVVYFRLFVFFRERASDIEASTPKIGF